MGSWLLLLTKGISSVLFYTGTPFHGLLARHRIRRKNVLKSSAAALLPLLVAGILLSWWNRFLFLYPSGVPEVELEILNIYSHYPSSVLACFLSPIRAKAATRESMSTKTSRESMFLSSSIHGTFSYHHDLLSTENVMTIYTCLER